MRRWLTLVLVSVLGVVGLLPAAVSAATTPKWATTSLPNPPLREGQLTGMSCSSASACAGSGFFQNAGGNIAPMAEDPDQVRLDRRGCPGSQRCGVLAAARDLVPGNGLRGRRDVDLQLRQDLCFRRSMERFVMVDSVGAGPEGDSVDDADRSLVHECHGMHRRRLLHEERQ